MISKNMFFIHPFTRQERSPSIKYPGGMVELSSEYNLNFLEMNLPFQVSVHSFKNCTSSVNKL